MLHSQLYLGGCTCCGVKKTLVKLTQALEISDSYNSKRMLISLIKRLYKLN